MKRVVVLSGAGISAESGLQTFRGADDVVPFEDSVELLSKSGLPETALIEAGQDQRLADPEPLEALLRVVEG